VGAPGRGHTVSEHDVQQMITSAANTLLVACTLDDTVAVELDVLLRARRAVDDAWRGAFDARR